MKTRKTSKISIIGAGRLGGALAIALARKGYTIENLFVRERAKAEPLARAINPRPGILFWEDAGPIDSDIVIIATQDFEIANVADTLADKLSGEIIVFHTSGSFSSEILRPLQEKGCPAGSIHPLVSVSDPFLGAERFAGAYFCVEGDQRAISTAKRLTAALGGASFSIETRFKPLYHAAAVTACGHLVALVDVALEMLQGCGLDEAAAQKTFLPLIESTVENLAAQTTSEALTGTFARADVTTFERHLKAIDENMSPQIRDIYLQLGERSAHLAERRGVSPQNVQEILRQISLAKKNLKC